MRTTFFTAALAALALAAPAPARAGSQSFWLCQAQTEPEYGAPQGAVSVDLKFNDARRLQVQDSDVSWKPHVTDHGPLDVAFVSSLAGPNRIASAPRYVSVYWRLRAPRPNLRLEVVADGARVHLGPARYLSDSQVYTALYADRPADVEALKQAYAAGTLVVRYLDADGRVAAASTLDLTPTGARDEDTKATLALARAKLGQPKGCDYIE